MRITERSFVNNTRKARRKRTKIHKEQIAKEIIKTKEIQKEKRTTIADLVSNAFTMKNDDASIRYLGEEKWLRSALLRLNVLNTRRKRIVRCCPISICRDASLVSTPSRSQPLATPPPLL